MTFDRLEQLLDGAKIGSEITIKPLEPSRGFLTVSVISLKWISGEAADAEVLVQCPICEHPNQVLMSTVLVYLDNEDSFPEMCMYCGWPAAVWQSTFIDHFWRF